MNIKDLKVGDLVYIREDLEVGKCYGKRVCVSRMLDGEQEICKVDYDEQTFEIEAERNEKWFLSLSYTPEMIDWEKTAMLNKNIPKKDTSNIKPTYDGTVLSWDDIEVTRHRDDKEDLEKAVMMLLLKKEGYSFVDVRRIVKNTKVKWVPKAGQKIFFITYTGNISSGVYYGAWSVHEELLVFGNCFKTKEEAMVKLEQVKKLLSE